MMQSEQLCWNSVAVAWSAEHTDDTIANPELGTTYKSDVTA